MPRSSNKEPSESPQEQYERFRKFAREVGDEGEATFKAKLGAIAGHKPRDIPKVKGRKPR